MSNSETSSESSKTFKFFVIIFGVGLFSALYLAVVIPIEWFFGYNDLSINNDADYVMRGFAALISIVVTWALHSKIEFFTEQILGEKRNFAV